MNYPHIFIVLVVLGGTIVSSQTIMENQNVAFTIPYTTSFRSDKVNKAMGCQHNVIYGTYLYPQGSKDALNLYLMPHNYGGTNVRCLYKTLFAKIFGTAQNYAQLKNPTSIAGEIKRSLTSKFKNLVLDWKKPLLGDNLSKSRQFLNEFIRQLTNQGYQVYLKAPASYFCHDVDGKPFLLGVDSAKNFIIEMYGEQVHKYKDVHSIFNAEKGLSEQNYPDENCPKYPSYKQLLVNFKNKNFFIEKTLQHEQAGYLGNQFLMMLEQVEELYNKLVFFDGYPPNMIKI